MFKAAEDFFHLEIVCPVCMPGLYARIVIFNKMFCIWKILLERVIFERVIFGKVRFNAYICLWLSELPKICALSYTKLPALKSFWLRACWRKGTKSIAKIKKKRLPSFVYSKSCLTVSSPVKFYGTAKLHKVPNNSTVQQLPFKPIIYNNGTATYDLAKYLAELLKPWSELQYTIKNGDTLTKKSRKSRFLLFLKPLFTSAFLDQRIDIIIKRIIYDKKKIYPDMPKKKKWESYCVSALIIHTWTLTIKHIFKLMK